MNDLNTEHQDDTILILVIVIYIYISLSLIQFLNTVSKIHLSLLTISAMSSL